MKKVILLLVVSTLLFEASAYEKLSLVERFTNASCGPCATLNVWYNPLTQGWVNSGTISHIVYNTWWPGAGDPMYLLNQADNTTRTNYYGCNYVPWFDVNGTHTTESQGALTTAVTNGNSQFAPFNIVITQRALGETLIEVGVKIIRDPTDVTVFSNTKLRVALTEKTVSFTNPPGSNGERNFFSISRKMLPNAGGTEFPIPAPGDSVEVILNYVPTSAFLAAVNLDSIRVVAFIQNDNSKVIYQSAMQELIPNYVATIGSTSPDVIIENNASAEFTAVINNVGILEDTYTITASLDGPSGWMGEFTTENGTFPFGDIDSVHVAVDDSTSISLTLNPNTITGSGIITLDYASKNDPGVQGSITFRVVTQFGIDILVIDASENGYGELVSNSLANVFTGTVGIVSRDALNASVVLDNYQMIAWSEGPSLPAFYPEEVDALQGYLDGGGNLFINGQDIGSDIFGAGGQSQFAQSFYNNYLHASLVGTTAPSFLINGIPGDPISSNMQFVLNSIYTRSPDDIAPYDSYASSIFIFWNGPKMAGIKAATPTYKVVYFGFGFEQIPVDSIWTKNTLLSRIINYFDVEPLVLPSAPVLVSPSNSEVIDSSSVLFVWQQSQSQVMKYWIELDTTDQFTSPFINSEITDTTYLFTGLLSEKNYWWRVKALNPVGWGDYSEVRTFSTLFVGVDDKSPIPTQFSLEQNYPNPFNPSTKITYSIAEESQVSLKIYDVMGGEVVELVSEKQSPGSYNVEFDAGSLSSGTYFYKLTAGEFTSVKKMVLLK
jgi:Secretion system C-terminal sorting domain/Fibronectin type III domain